MLASGAGAHGVTLSVPTARARSRISSRRLMPAADGDEIWLIAGVYTGPGNRDIVVGAPDFIQIRSFDDDPDRLHHRLRGQSRRSPPGVSI